jgi:cholinesterase
VTLFGESWGGGSTSYQMLSDKSKNLFHKGILMSGTALNGIYSLIPRRNWALRLCLEIGYSGPTDDKNLLEFLESADEKEIVLASSKVLTKKEQAEENLIAPFGPTIEPFDNGNCFISDEIVKMAENCWGNEIDIMIGATSNECAAYKLFVENEEEVRKITNFLRYVPREIKVDDDKRKMHADKLLKNYYGMLKPSKNNIEGTMQAMNDYGLWHPLSRIVRSRENSNKSGKSFIYRFDYNSENNLFKKFTKLDDIDEAIHGDDVPYLFTTPFLGSPPAIDSVGFKRIKLMLSTFTEFAKTGNPNVDELGDVEWLPATFDEPFLGININQEKCKILVLPEAERVKAIDEIFIEENVDLY